MRETLRGRWVAISRNVATRKQITNAQLRGTKWWWFPLVLAKSKASWLSDDVVRRKWNADQITYLSYYSMKIFRILPSVVAFRISAASISFRGGFFNNCVNAALLLFSSASKSGLIPGCLCIMADSTKMDKSCKANYTNIQIFIFWRGS